MEHNTIVKVVSRKDGSIVRIIERTTNDHDIEQIHDTSRANTFSKYESDREVACHE